MDRFHIPPEETSQSATMVKSNTLPSLSSTIQTPSTRTSIKLSSNSHRLAPPARQLGKKSHACGPCRRLKRKCDLKVPCGTCSRGKASKLDECLKAPAVPLDEARGLAAADPGFARVKKTNRQVPPPPIVSKETIMADANDVKAPAAPDTPTTPTVPTSIKRTSNDYEGNKSPSKKKRTTLVKHPTEIYFAQPIPRVPYAHLDQPPPLSPEAQLQMRFIQQQQQQEQQYQPPQYLEIAPQIQPNYAPNPVPVPHDTPEQRHPANYNAQTQTPSNQQSHRQSVSSYPDSHVNQASRSDSSNQATSFHHPPQQQYPTQQQIHQFSQLQGLHQNDTPSISATPTKDNLRSALKNKKKKLNNKENEQSEVEKMNNVIESNRIEINELLGDTKAKQKAKAKLTSVSKQTTSTKLAAKKQAAQKPNPKKESPSASPTTPQTQTQAQPKCCYSKSKSPDTPISETKKRFINLLPTQTQTKFLTDFYLQNLDYIYHPLHHPSFLIELDNFWAEKQNVDIGFLAVLFMVLSLASIHLPHGIVSIEKEEIKRCQKIWFDSSRECARLNDENRVKGEFNLYTLQIFSLSQLYFYATKRAEQLHDLLAKAVKDAYDMCLDSDDGKNPDLLQQEMKRRLWWDICGCDSFFALSLGRKPLINSFDSKVPYPANAHDEDITSESIRICSPDIPTYNSFNIYRADMMRLFNGIFNENHLAKAGVLEKFPHLALVKDPVFKRLLTIDIELGSCDNSWYFKLDRHDNVPFVKDIRFHFQHHMLHTCICIHRFRIYQNYLSDDIPIAWEIGKSSALSLFKVYRKLREFYDIKNPLFLSQIHQSFTGSVIQSMLLLLSHKLTAAEQVGLYQDIDLMLSDLDVLGREVFVMKPEVLKESLNVLNVLKRNLNKNIIELGKEHKDIVSNVFGGRRMIDNYLKKCTVSFIIEQSSSQPNDSEKSRTEACYSESLDTPDTPNSGLKFQLGTPVTDELIHMSLASLDQLYLNQKVEETGNIHERNVQLQKQNHPQEHIPDSQANGTPSDKQLHHTQVPLISSNTVQFEPQNVTNQGRHSFPIIKTNQQCSSPAFQMNFMANGEFNLNESLWKDFQEDELNELNSLYQKEFIGFKVN